MIYDITQARQDIEEISTALDVLDLLTVNDLVQDKDIDVLQTTVQKLELDLSNTLALLTDAINTNTVQGNALAVVVDDIGDVAVGVAESEAAILVTNQTITSNESSLALYKVGVAAQLSVLDGSITSNASAVDTLSAQVTLDIDGVLTVVASDITVLRSEQDTTVALIDSLAQTTATADLAQGTKIDALEASVGSLSAGALSEATAREALDVRVATNEEDITSEAVKTTELTASIEDIIADVDVIGIARSDLETRVYQTEADLVSTSSDITSLNNSVGALEGNTSANAIAVTGLTSRVSTTEDGVTANTSLVTSLSTTVGLNTSSITATQTSVDGISATYGVEVDNNGHISGFGLTSELVKGLGDTTRVVSEFSINADTFSITSPTTQLTPFSIDLAGNVYMNSAIIMDLAADNITTGTLSADIEITAAAFTGGSININDRFLVDEVGKVEIRSTVSATSARLEFVDDVIQVFDESNQLRVKIGRLV